MTAVQPDPTPAKHERPQRLEGRYIDGMGRGCKTCGWRIPNDLPDADEQWNDHDHDPMIDINERVLAGQRWFTVTEVVWLLALIDPTNWALDQTEPQP